MPAYGCLLTTTGRAKIANAIASGVPVVLTAMSVGDGAGNPVTPQPTQGTMVREVYRRTINSMRISTPTELEIEMVVPADVGPFTVRECAVWDDDGDMFAISALPTSVKSVPNEGAPKEMVIVVTIRVDNADAVTVQVNPHLVIATRTWVEGNFMRIPEGGSVGQFLRRKTNIPGDYEHADIGPDGINFTVNSIEEVQTLAENQAVVDWNNITTNGIAVYIQSNIPDAGLVRLIKDDDYTIESSTSIELSSSWPSGSKILGSQNEPNSNTTPEGIGALSRQKNLADLDDKALARENMGLSYASFQDVLDGILGKGTISPRTLNEILVAVSLTKLNGKTKSRQGDLNDIEKTGFYDYDIGSMNRPIDTAGGLVLHVEASVQAFQLAISRNANNQMMAFRSRDALNSWQEWLWLPDNRSWSSAQSAISNPAIGKASHQILPPGYGNGIIHNWGKATVSSIGGGLYIPFSQPFSQANPNVMVSMSSAHSSSSYGTGRSAIFVTSRSTNGFTVRNTFMESINIDWFAVGK